MGTVNVTLGEDARLNLILGQQLENAVTSVVFDFSAWQTAYGSGTLALSVQRPGDEQPYAVTLTTSGTDATWSVTDLDTAYKGVGHIQLTYTVGSAIKKSVVYKFTVYESLGANGEYPSPGQTWQEEIEDELADVKEDFDDLESRVEVLEQGGGSGLTNDIKVALDQLAQKVAYIDDDGQDYYDALHNALYPPATLTSITCVYTQSGTVYNTDTLDSLKSDLVVTAHYDNSTTATVTTYTLSGTLTTGTSTITVSYGGKTTTFNVTVTDVTGGALYYWDLTSSLTDLVDGNVATVTGAVQSSQGLTFDSASDYAVFPNVIGTNRRIEVDVTSIDRKTGSNHGRFITWNSKTLADPSVDSGFLWRGNTGYWAIFRGTYGSWVTSELTDPTMFNGKTVVLEIDENKIASVSMDGVELINSVSAVTLSSDDNNLYIGSSTGNSLYDFIITGVRVYEVV